MLSLIALLLLVWLLLQTETVQNFLIHKVTDKVAKDLHTEMRIGHVSFSLFNKMNLENILIRDQRKDTLVSAQAFRLRITDWFFLKKKVELKYIGLENATIKLFRRDSVWNYQFLADYFASPGQPKKKKKAIQLNLKKIDLVNVRLLKKDLWNGQTIDLQLGSLATDIDKVDLARSLFLVNNVEIDKMLFSLSDYHALRPKKPKSKTVKDTSMYFNTGGITARVGSVKITNSYFADLPDLKGRKPYPHFDTRHMIFSKLNADIQNFSFVKDTITAHIDIKANERSGIIIHKLVANFRLIPQMMELARLDLQTNKSIIRDYVAFHFQDFNKDFGDFERKVIINGHFVNSVTHTDDIALLSSSLKDWNKKINFTMDFKGTVADFRTRKMHVQLDTHTFINGDLSMQGFPNFDTAHMAFTNLFFQMTKTEATPLIPSLRGTQNPDFGVLGVIQYRGNFNGTIHDFYTAGTMSSALGSIYADAHLQLPSRGIPTYAGTVAMHNFNFGRFIHSPIIGNISFDGRFSGKGFTLQNVSATLQGRFASAEVNHYDYHNAVVNGSIKKRFFTGDVKINDDNANLVSNIRIDMSGPAPKFNILGDVVNANLQKLHFVNKNLILTGLFDLDFSGRNIDDYIGSAKLLNASIQQDSLHLNFDSLAVNAYYNANNEKTLSIESNEFNVSVEGKYRILDLPNSFQAFLHQYYPSVIKQPGKSPAGQNFVININTRNVDDYTKIFLPQVTGLDSAVFTGSINTLDSNYFYMHANIPNLHIAHYRLEKTDIEGRGNLHTLNVTGNIGKAYTSDSFYFPNSLIHIQSQQDHSVIALHTRANNTLNDAQLNADVYTLSDGVKINFQPSSFVLNNKKWDLEKQGEIIIRKDYTSAQNVKFSQGLQELTVETVAGQRDLRIKMQNLSIGDFTPLFVKDPKLEGIANGTVYMHNFFGAFNVEGDVQADQFRLNGDSVGLVKIKGNFDQRSKLVTYNIRSDNEKYKFAIDGEFNARDSVAAPLNARINLTDARIAILNDLLGSLFSNVTGQANGNLQVVGTFGKPAIVGNVNIRNASLLINYTQVRYFIDNTSIQFNEDNIDLGNIVLRDEKNNTATVSGKIYEHALQNMRYDLHINTSKLLALNTQASDNPQFYGRAFAKGIFSITGPQENMQMDIIATAADSSHIFIPLSSRSSTSNDFIIYKQYGTEIKKVKTSKNQLNIDLDLTANSLARIDVILDQQTGDVIRATGNGRLQIQVPGEGNMTMKGRYAIERGRYDFNFQSIVKKPFNFAEGGNNYIEWTGSPYDANIHLSANYTATHVSLNDLVSSQSGSSIGGNVRGYRGDVFVIADLTGKLSHPGIKFRLDFPTGSTIKTDADFNLFLNRIQSDDNEMLKQVTYLIVFGSFAPYGENNAATNFASVGVNTISSVITSEVNKILSDVLFKLTGDRSLQFDVSTSTYSSSSWYGANATQSRLDRQAVNLKVNKSLLNGNVIVTVGGDLDFNLSNNTAGNFQWLPDLSVQIILSRDRKLRGIIFNRSSLDVGTSSNSGIGRRNRQGVSISYYKDFERLFGTQPKKARPDTIRTPENSSMN